MSDTSKSTAFRYNHAAINAAIARDQGWTTLVSGLSANNSGLFQNNLTGKWVEELPSYTTSLDAMAEARKRLTPQEQAWYGGTIKCFAECCGAVLCGEELYSVATQPALHHAIAYLKARALWDEKTMGNISETTKTETL